MFAVIEPRLTQLDATVAEHLRAVRPRLHDRLLEAVRAAMAAQGRSLTGGQGRGLALGVETAVDAFVAGVADPARDVAGSRAVFHRLGRTEYREGHRVDALRSVLTVGGRAMWAFLVDDAELSAADRYVLASALFGYVDVLAGAAAEGYLDEQQDSAQDWALVRRRLVTLLVQSDPPRDAVRQAAAEAARWPLPTTLALVAVEGADADHVGRAVGSGSVAAVIGDVVRLVVPEPATPGRLAALRRALAGRRAALGPTVGLAHARTSYRFAGRALRLLQDGQLSAEDLLVCDEHLVALLSAWEPGLADRLADTLLGDLDGVLADTLHAWLRTQGQVVPTAAALHAHPQTVRYRLRKLRRLLDLDDPDTRLALQLALHHRDLLRRAGADRAAAPGPAAVPGSRTS